LFLTVLSFRDLKGKEINFINILNAGFLKKKFKTFFLRDVLNSLFYFWCYVFIKSS